MVGEEGIEMSESEILADRSTLFMLCQEQPILVIQLVLERECRAREREREVER